MADYVRVKLVKAKVDYMMGDVIEQSAEVYVERDYVLLAVTDEMRKLCRKLEERLENRGAGR